MTHRHYGQIGDIWKHLPLADVLPIEQPAQYWESHAGAAQYELTHSAQRDFGVFHFLNHAHHNDVLADSAYFWLTATLAQSQKPIYPGSPGIAMATLNPKDTRFQFCDTDQKSLDSIRHTAQEMDGSSRSVKTLYADGLIHMRKHLRNMSFTQAKNTFLFIDPDTLLEPDVHGFTALDLFCEATLRGVKTMLWFGSQGQCEHNALLEQFNQAFLVADLDMNEHHVWLGQIHLDDVTHVRHGFNPGVWGCGLLCANLSHESLATCAHLGRALEQVYTSARFPDNTAGRLSFSQIMFCTETDGSNRSKAMDSSAFGRVLGFRNRANRHIESLT